MYDEKLEPTYNETVSIESYYEVQAELEKEHNMRIDAETKLEELISTILEYGNKYEFTEAYPKLIEYLKGENLIWNYLRKEKRKYQEIL